MTMNKPKMLDRFTPTGVGTTTVHRRPARALQVHPHGRGDNQTESTRYARDYGSPPRAWGQQRIETAFPDATRFTPTGVGTTLISPPCARLPGVHPHGRGDNKLVRNDIVFDPGSPPRAWGQRRRCRRHRPPDRFTPTGVGTTLAIELVYTSLSVHPHGRGDNFTLALVGGNLKGSPPRAWGQQHGISW